MKINKNCNIIEDLLPLYVEGLVSEETKQEIEKHLKECKSCLNIFKEMKKDNILFEIESNNEEIKEDNENEIKCIKKIKRKFTFKVLMYIFISIIITIFALNIWNTYRIVQDKNGKYILYNINTGNIQKGMDGTNMYANYTINDIDKTIEYKVIFTFNKDNICINARTVLSGLNEKELEMFKNIWENTNSNSNMKIENEKLYMNENIYRGKMKEDIIKSLQEYDAIIIDI